MIVNLKILVTKNEIEQLRETQDENLRSLAIYSLHRYRYSKAPTMSKLVLTHGHENGFRAAKKLLKALGMITETTYHVGVHASQIVPVPVSEAELGYDIKPDMDEYKKIYKLFHWQDLKDEKRIREVQNINGIYFDNLEEFKLKELEIVGKLKTLEENEENSREIKNLKKNLESIKQVLDKKVKVNSWREYNCQRLYSTFTNLPKESRKNIRNSKGYFYEVDIKASQPRLIKKCLSEMMKNYTEWDFKNLKIENISFEDWKNEVFLELDRFNDLTIDDFYNTVLGDYSKLKRDDIKDQFMWYFFDYHFKIKSGFFFNQYMYDNFPRINDFVRSLKKAQSFSKYNKHYYSISANLAKCEVDLILKKIAKRFLIENPNSNIFTIHDSLNVNFEDLEKLIKIVKEEYDSANVNLNFKIKDLKNNEEIKICQILKEPKKDNKKDNKRVTLGREYKESTVYCSTFLESSPTIPVQTRTWTVERPSKICQILKEPKKDNKKDNKRVTLGREYKESTVYCSTFLESSPTIPVQTRTWTVERPSKIRTLADGRFRVTLKNINYSSKKGETLEQFKARIFLLTGSKV